MKLLKKGLLIFTMFCLVGNVYAGSASTKLSALADSLIKGYITKTDATKTALAIFPLNCDEKLEKQRIGFAASEIMSHKFVASKSFTVVERGEINKLLAEQKLQSSGAVESETAVKLGKILGADVILVGNVQKVGGKYQVNARLVNAETSEVLSSGYEELDSSVFEDDARVYLNLVPEEQALGIYVSYNYRSNSNGVANYTEYSQAFTPKPFTTGFVGGGLTYKPEKTLLIDIGGSTLGNKAKFSNPTVHAFNNPRVDTIYASGNYIYAISTRFFCRAGIGIQKLTFSFNGASKEKSTKSTLFLKGGLEYRPQSRIGLGLNIKYDLTKITAISKFGNKLFELNQLSFEPAVSVYF